jgi:glutamyl-tRNA synthetase
VTVRVRLAPSPTGNLHIGTARTAVFNWLYARRHQGTFILRVEDTDLERSRPEFTENILDGLTWLGLTWDEGPYFQSQRFDLYKQAVKKLLEQGLAYRSYETPEELEAMREAQKAAKQAPRYDNRHRHLSTEQEAAYIAEGRTAVIRFIIDDEDVISWNDLVRGDVSWKGRDLGGDMVIARAAAPGEVGQPLYNFVVVVDDIDMQISHVIRGEDHIGNTPKQLLLYKALGAQAPIFGHTPLILNKEGKKLSKRDGATSISEFREMGYTPEAFVNYMMLLGWTPPDATQERLSLAEAATMFGFERVNQAGARFDWDKLNWLNGQYLHQIPISEMTDQLLPIWQQAGYDFADADRVWLEQITALIQPSLIKLNEAVELAKFYAAPILEPDADATKQLQLDDAKLVLRAVLDQLNKFQGDFTAEAVQALIAKVIESQNLKKGVVLRSLRAALMCTMQGPDLSESWVILNQRGWDKLRLEKGLGLL